MVSKGYFVIADITGYTEFLTQAGLEEAHGILDHLFEGLLNAMKPPLQVSNFEGDAILAFVPEGSFIEGQTFLEILENIYTSFMRVVERMERNAGCNCDACDYIPKLDLKLFVHSGNYILHQLRGREELTGPDVILVHRMMKNDVYETTGLKSYALFTRKAVQDLELDAQEMEMLPYKYSYMHLGEIPMLMYDLRKVYNEKRAEQRIFVRPDEAHTVTEIELPLSPPLVWDYLTRNELSKEWMITSTPDEATGASCRIQRGTHFQCIRRTEQVRFTILDWRPFEYFTIEAVNVKGQIHQSSYCLLSTSGGSRLVHYWKLESQEISEVDRTFYTEVNETSMSRLLNIITNDLVSGILQNSQNVK